MKALALALIAALMLPGSASAARKKKGLLHPLEQQFNLATTAAPQDGEVCFSPDEPCDMKLIKFLDSANSTLDVAIFDTTLDQLVHHLLVQSRKIKVRVVADLRQAKGKHSLIPVLIKGGVQVRYGRQRGIMHHKFMIVDGKRLETGSFNFTNNAATANQENQVYLSDPKIVDRYRRRFESMWLAARDPESIKGRH